MTTGLTPAQKVLVATIVCAGALVMLGQAGLLITGLMAAFLLTAKPRRRPDTSDDG